MNIKRNIISGIGASTSVLQAHSKTPSRTYEKIYEPINSKGYATAKDHYNIMLVGGLQPSTSKKLTKIESKKLNADIHIN